MTVDVVAAVDLGATSGRVMLGAFDRGELSLTQVARFRNGPVRVHDSLHWDILGLYQDIVAGLGAAVRRLPEVRSVGVDSWAIDYGLFRNGALLGNPHHYRDDRNPPAAESVAADVSPDEQYQRNGLQFLPFNTIYQLRADAMADQLELADRLLMIPDLISYWLSGVAVTELTNASTMGLLSVHEPVWDEELIERLGYPRRLFTELVAPGTELGGLLPSVAGEIGKPLRVIAVGSHDTASSVVAVPAQNPNFAYISCGTWALVGVETDGPVLTEAGRAANFTNERGVDGRYRYLHNVMGMWLLNESLREWERGGETVDLPSLLREAEAVTAPVAIFDPDHSDFMAPGDMATRIAKHAAEHGLPVPASRAETVRAIVESLATAFARNVHAASEYSGVRVDAIHIVGGGSQNALLCQRTADLAGVPVHAGPVEATAIGNMLIQARTLGVVGGDLEALRRMVAAAFPLTTYRPGASLT